MTNVSQIIDDSALPVEIKNAVKPLVEQFQDFKLREADAVADMHRTKAAINERQYNMRLAEPMWRNKREQVIINQIASRALFVNCVLRTHEIRRHLESLSRRIREYFFPIFKVKEESAKVVLVALTLLIRDKGYSGGASSVLKETESVSDVTYDRLWADIPTIFDGKKSGEGLIGNANFMSYPLPILDATDEQRELETAIKLGISVRDRCEQLWSELTVARCKCNIPQFTQRMEQVLVAGETEKIEQISGQRLNAEACLYLATTAYKSIFEELRTAEIRLQSALAAALAAFDAAGDRKSFLAYKAMSHCIAGWSWHGVLTAFIEHRSQSCNPDTVLNDLAFDWAEFASVS